jgi:peptidoglycan/LPS O-acetylase OafA/YrhL
VSAIAVLHCGLIQLRRITSTGKFIPEIDGLRFIAIVSVVLYHFYGFVQAESPREGGTDALRMIAEHGYRGVNLFYVISGFILGVPFADHRLRGRPPVSLPRYFLRRLTRLEPPYVLNLLICAALLLANGGSIAVLFPHFVTSAFYVHNIWFGEQSLINPVAWSLEIEVQFYCLAPLLALLFSIRSKFKRRAVLLGLTLVIGIVQLHYWDSAPRFKLSILYAIQFFLVGFLLSDICLVDWKEKSPGKWQWDLVAIGGWLALFGLEDREIWVALPFLALTVYIATFRGLWMSRVFTNPLIVTLGGMCYSIYLFHYVLIPPVLRLTANLPVGNQMGLRLATRALAYLAVLLAISCSYFVLVERPCMSKQWPKRALAWLTRFRRSTRTARYSG